MTEIELRFTVEDGLPHAKPKLQYRQCQHQNGDAIVSDWENVPTVAVPMVDGEPPSCCGGGYHWGHKTWCPNRPD